MPDQGRGQQARPAGGGGRHDVPPVAAACGSLAAPVPVAQRLRPIPAPALGAGAAHSMCCLPAPPMLARIESKRCYGSTVTPSSPADQCSSSVLFFGSRRDRCLDTVLAYTFERTHGTPEERRNSRAW